MLNSLAEIEEVSWPSQRLHQSASGEEHHLKKAAADQRHAGGAVQYTHLHAGPAPQKAKLGQQREAVEEVHCNTEAAHSQAHVHCCVNCLEKL